MSAHQTTHAHIRPRDPRPGAATAGAMRLLVTGGSGVLGRAVRPVAAAAGDDVRMPGHTELDLFDPAAVKDAVRDADAILHLATRIPSLDQMGRPEAWRENDRLRAVASSILVDAALEAEVAVYVQPSVTFVYPEGAPASEETLVADVPPIMRSALAAEQQAARLAAAGRRGVVLRFGLLDGPGTGNDVPNPHFGATLHVADAARALAAALTVESGIYNVCRPGGLVSTARFAAATGWRALR
jgi:nucleoside-diphosphate-sugar epimerase